ncbi:MAG: response regulator, partial [Rhodospirillales bacterium]|nr:response regulator [Rhodospirillales bacterium]
MSNKPKILIVDDEADNIRKPLVRQLRREFRDYEFLEAENGEIALGLIEENRPALVILDLMMPVMNGI